MIPSVIAPSAIYSAFMRPAASLHSPFPAHPSFLVEDLLRINRPSGYQIHDPHSPCASPPTSTPFSIPDNSRLLDRVSPSITEKHGSCSPKTPVSSKDPTYLKFGVSAILAPSPKKGKCLYRPNVSTDNDKYKLKTALTSVWFSILATSPSSVHGMHPKGFPVPYFDGSFCPFVRSSYFPGEYSDSNDCTVHFRGLYSVNNVLERYKIIIGLV